jgi:KDO2-lipid IV(A) lauroyltransferase
MNTYEERRKRPPTLSHRLEHWSIKSLVKGLERLDWFRAGRIGESIGELGFRPLKIRRHVVETQIAAAFPQLSHEQVTDLARRSYRHLGRNAVEASIIAGPKAPNVLDLVEKIEGWEHVEQSQASGRGTIGVAAHHGNWELLGAFLAAKGIRPVVVVRGMDNRLFEDYVNDNRSRLGLDVVHDTQGVRAITQGLRGGRFIAILADQGVLGLASSFVPFFGRPAKTPRGFAVFALRFNADAVFMDLLREPNGKFRIVFEPIQVERTGDKEKDIDSMVERYSQILEKWVRQYPDQYFWQHRRWRRQPEGTPVELRDPTLKDPSLWTPSR